MMEKGGKLWNFVCNFSLQIEQSVRSVCEAGKKSVFGLVCLNLIFNLKSIASMASKVISINFYLYYTAFCTVTKGRNIF